MNPNAATDARADFHVNERVYAGYLENTITYNQFCFNTGVRVESTSDGVEGNQQNAAGIFAPIYTTNNYVYVLPSAGVQYNLDNYRDFRAVYSIGSVRPNYGDIAPFLTYNPSGTYTASDPDLTGGNPNLKATWAENLDLLGEHYLKNVGVI